MKTEIAILDSVQITKPFIADTSQSIISSIQNGEVNPLDLKLKVKAVESVLETIKPVLDQHARTEAEKYGAKTFEHLGASVELFEAGTKYDYSACNDEQYNELLAMQEVLKEKMKEREAFLKSIKGSMNIVNESGEAVTVFAPIKKSTSSLKITIK